MKVFRQNSGFTLLELIVAVAVLAIVLAIAIPSFQGVIQNNYSISLSNDLIIALKYARSEAIRQGTNVSICPTADQTFSGCGSNWNQGWLIFVDITGGGNFNSSTPLLRANALTGQNSSIITSPTINVVTYNSAGFANPSTANTIFNVSAVGCKGDYARNITVSLTGRIVVSSALCP